MCRCSMPASRHVCMSWVGVWLCVSVCHIDMSVDGSCAGAPCQHQGMCVCHGSVCGSVCVCVSCRHVCGWCMCRCSMPASRQVCMSWVSVWLCVSVCHVDMSVAGSCAGAPCQHQGKCVCHGSVCGCVSVCHVDMSVDGPCAGAPCQREGTCICHGSVCGCVCLCVM